MTYVVTNKSTVHGLTTPHGFATPHRFPQETDTPVDFFRMVELLYPTGQAFELPEGSDFVELHNAFNASLLQLVYDGYATINSTLPDNNGFDANDCSIWEYRLGIDYNASLSTAQRRTNIYNAVAFPQNIKARQHPLYIQDQLNKAGFNVVVYENKFFDSGGNIYYKTPAQVLGTVITQTQLGPPTQLGGDTQLGGGGYSVIANSEFTETYSLGGELWPTFFISGSTITTPFSIPSSREREFRLAVLKLKPAETVAFLIGNFV